MKFLTYGVQNKLHVFCFNEHLASIIEMMNETSQRALFQSEGEMHSELIIAGSYQSKFLQMYRPSNDTIVGKNI